ncbi:hypothetical protein [Dolosigranulum pigrum]|nr:hypothetical protein [Dolosigranulum pigrum]
MVLEKIESSILNGLGYIGRLEKKNGNRVCFWGNDLFSMVDDP